MWLVWAVMGLIQQAVTPEELINGRRLNPEYLMNISQIIQYWGYPSEEYEILTADGYYLKANRIPNGIHSLEKTGPKPVVLLVSGLLVEGRCWVINLPSNSLGFVLADAGYDVWIINNRGTTWSRRHQNLTTDQEEFWDFSFHEMGIYDIPATINFILQKTKQDSLYYIGHSQGASLGFLVGMVVNSVNRKLYGKYYRLYIFDLLPFSLEITQCFHEMGIYDIPATINFILQKTKQDSLYYIGHSQGASL
ncbi:gastric triacylglycerol lipase-like, partial [Python bivittatus]|uniref:Gastric triacylglycerol lipase-like n=1 Tax=Python bivittatus TaxID=176946 RepID=A0A9F2REY5_PYTBI